MKKIKNKFIIVILIFVVAVLGVETYKSIVLANVDRNSYVVLVDGEAELNNSKINKNIKLVIDKKELLNKEDKLKTIGEESLAIIKWGDGSITRIGGNSELIIEEADVEQSLLNIKISFHLESGKTWSDVISFIGDESYFHQSFADTTAAVRGTTFEVNLDNDYLFVNKHEVKLTRADGKTKVISENKPFNLTKFSFIDLVRFIQTVQDNAWKSLNIDLDKEFYNNLKLELEDIGNYKVELIENIEDLAEEKKEELYASTLAEYQKLNFISTDDIELYRKKLEFKERLIKLSPEEEKENLLINTLYDFKSLAKNKEFEELTQIISILGENRQYLPDLDINISEYLNFEMLDDLKIPDGLKKEFQNNFNSIKDTLNIGDINLKDNGLIDSTKKSFNDITDKIDNLTDLIK